MNWMLLGGALVCAGFVQGLTGFGFGLVSMSLMPLFISVKQAAVISTAFTLLATVVTFARHYREYNWRQGAVFLISVCVGVPAGVFFLEHNSETVLVRVMGGLMLAYAAREFLVRNPVKTFPPVSTIPLGLFSGVMSGAFNLGGVPSAAYAYAQPWGRGQVMGFLQVMITLSCVLRMFIYQGTGLLTGISWLHATLLVVPAYMAIWLGHLTLQRMDPRRTRQAVFAFIAMSGAYYLLVH